MSKLFLLHLQELPLLSSGVTSSCSERSDGTSDNKRVDPGLGLVSSHSAEFPDHPERITLQPERSQQRWGCDWPAGCQVEFQREESCFQKGAWPQRHQAIHGAAFGDFVTGLQPKNTRGCFQSRVAAPRLSVDSCSTKCKSTQVVWFCLFIASSSIVLISSVIYIYPPFENTSILKINQICVIRISETRLPATSFHLSASFIQTYWVTDLELNITGHRQEVRRKAPVKSSWRSDPLVHQTTLNRVMTLFSVYNSKENQRLQEHQTNKTSNKSITNTKVEGTTSQISVTFPLVLTPGCRWAHSPFIALKYTIS